MRCAGSEPITNYLKSSLNMGAAAQQGAMTQSAIKNAGTAIAGQVGAAGVNAAGQVESAGIIGAAQESLADSQAKAAMFETVGQVAGGAIGSFGGVPGAGAGGDCGSDMKSFGYTDKQINQYNKGGIDYGYL